jgi:hypothetical protein
MSHTASSAVARASTPRAAAISCANWGEPPAMLPLLGELSRISTNALGACPATPLHGAVGPAAAITSSATRSVRRKSKSQF